jgi:hypothetical protein
MVSPCVKVRRIARKSASLTVLVPAAQQNGVPHYPEQERRDHERSYMNGRELQAYSWYLYIELW